VLPPGCCSEEWSSVLKSWDFPPSNTLLGQFFNHWSLQTFFGNSKKLTRFRIRLFFCSHSKRTSFFKFPDGIVQNLRLKKTYWRQCFLKLSLKTCCETNPCCLLPYLQFIFTLRL
jgi:hypothetical protein